MGTSGDRIFSWESNHSVRTGTYFFLKCEGETAAPIGTALPKRLAEPIGKLSSTEQEQIEEIYGA